MKKFLSKVAVHFSRHKNIYIGVLMLLFALLVIFRTSCIKASLPSKIVGMIVMLFLLYFCILLLYSVLSPFFDRDNIEELIASLKMVKMARWRDIFFAIIYLGMDVSCFAFTYKYLKSWGFLLFGFGGLGIPFLLRGDNPRKWHETIYGVISWLEIQLFSICLGLVFVVGSFVWILQIIFILLGIKVNIIKF